MSTRKKIKNKGQVFTPDYLVKEMLNYVGYTPHTDLLQRHVIDNSCGEGAFLLEVVRRYIETAFAQQLSQEKIVTDLSKFVHGIDSDAQALEACRKKLTQLATSYGLHQVAWDLRCGDTLLLAPQYQAKMDFVVGNPPYVRVHNLEENYDLVKQYTFAKEGMTDLYLVFFEIGLRMLSPTGKLCYITPSSWLSSVAAHQMRQHITLYRNLESLIDLGHFQAFEHITTYSLITILDRKKQENYFDYYVFDEQSLRRQFVERLSYEDCYQGKFLLR